MFKDDRFISILSGIVLMVAIGTVVQRGGPLVEYFRGGPEGPVLVRDRTDAVPGALTVTDVLANDRELSARDREGLAIVADPPCGNAFVQDGQVHYVPETSCVGEQVIVYGIGRTDGPTGELIVAIAPPEIDETVAVPEPVIAAAPEGLTPGGLRDGDTGAGTEPTTTTRSETAAVPLSPAPPGDADAGRDRDSESGDAAVALADPDAPEVTRGAPDAPRPVVALDDADPLGARVPGAMPRPLGPAQIDETPIRLGTAPADASPVAGSAGPAALGPVADESPALAQTDIVAPVARPSTAATRAPEALRTELTDRRNNDFAAASSRGGLLSRPTRASTTAAPAPTVLAQIRESDQPPTIGNVAEAWRPGDLAAIAPADAGVSLPADDENGGPIRRGDPGGLAAPVPDTSSSAELAAATAAIPSGPEPRRTEPAALRFGASAGDRVSQLSPPPSIDSRGPNRFDPTTPEPIASISIARVDRSVGAFRSPGAPTIGRGPDTLAGPSDDTVARAPVPGTSFGEQGQVALAAPASGLGEVRSLGNALTIVPVDTTASPSGLAVPVPADESLTVAALPSGFNPDAEATAAPADGSGAGTSEVEEAGPELAALPSAEAACTIPPGITIDPRGGAFTQVIVKSPCHRGEVATLSYSGLSFALQMNEAGLGQVLAPGFEPRSKARLEMPDGEALDLDIPFGDIDRIIRVAVLWDSEISLELHALAKGRNIGSEGHIRPDNPGSLRKARRGGGFLTTYHTVDGVGQSVQVYTHVPRRGQPEIINLLIDYASRRRATSEATCGNGPFASPAFKVLRSTRGQMERMVSKRLSAIACEDVRTEGARLIERAVEEVVVSSR